ncbi:MAG TPA: SDR family NAD(P)-dependent oxidoreductase [Gaiellaceae bacterium]|nr:SDR family NAD(P)-dependent oxidoreductase [Gaiellaceae bacterium]
MRLEGKAALVTGAESGIGRTLAVGLAAEGALVHVNDLRDPAGVHAELPAERRGLSLAADVSDVGAVRAMFARLERLDVLVNCAGIVGWTNVLEPSEETWERVIDTNLKGTFFCSVEAAKLMRRTGGGSIVNVSTVVAARGMRNMAPYAASKGGINALTIQLAVELAPAGIRVNSFAPGATNVERNLVDDPDYAEKWAPLIPLGRIAEPEDMVGPAVFFASDESSHVTGQLLYVDGGWTTAGNFPDSYVEAAAEQGSGR